MAVVLRPSPPFLLLLITLPSLIRHSSAAAAATSRHCPPENSPNKKPYTHCTNLHTLNSNFHWTYTPQNSSLSLAFIAPPETPEGWIAWAINPTRARMAGSQALIAFKTSQGSMTVKTYNISSYTSIKEGKIAYEVTDVSAESSGDVMKIFATVRLPEKTVKVNHVWQVGGTVRGGRPMMHEVLRENKISVGELKLMGLGVDHGNRTTVVGGRSDGLGSIDAGVCGVLIIVGWLLVVL